MRGLIRIVMLVIAIGLLYSHYSKEEVKEQEVYKMDVYDKVKGDAEAYK